MALGERGRERWREGDLAAADAAFAGQVAIFPGNFEPYVSRALIAAARKDHDEALALLRRAVLRGFTDFPRLDRSEIWHPLRRNETYLGLMDSVPRLLEIERAWPGWNQFRDQRRPRELASILSDQATLDAIVEGMAPVLGPRLVSLWKRTSERATAARLEAYVAAAGESPDLAQAVARLFELYGAGGLRWEVVPKDVASRLGGIAGTAVRRLPDGPIRAGALTVSALAQYADRDRKGVLAPAAAETILRSLDQVLTGSPGPGLLALATEGSVRVESELGRWDRAAERYRRFRQSHGEDAATLDLVRDRLGSLALRLGGMPAFTTTALDGGTFDSEVLRGKVAVVDFWATWCKPCLDELPTLQRIQAKHPEDVVLLGISLDGPDDLPAEALKEFATARNVPGRLLHDGRGWESELVRRFGVKEIPFTVVVGPDGRVLAVGERGKQLERAVERALEELRPRPAASHRSRPTNAAIRAASASNAPPKW